MQVKNMTLISYSGIWPVKKSNLLLFPGEENEHALLTLNLINYLFVVGDKLNNATARAKEVFIK